MDGGKFLEVGFLGQVIYKISRNHDHKNVRSFIINLVKTLVKTTLNLLDWHPGFGVARSTDGNSQEILLGEHQFVEKSYWCRCQ